MPAVLSSAAGGPMSEVVVDEPTQSYATISLVCVSRGGATALGATLRSAVAEIGGSLAQPVHVAIAPGEPVAEAELPVAVKLFTGEDAAERRGAALAACGGDWVVLLSDDLVLAPGWGEAIGNAIAAHPAGNVFLSVLRAGGAQYQPGPALDLLGSPSIVALVKGAVLAGTASPEVRMVPDAEVVHQLAADIGGAGIDVAGSDWPDTSDGVTIVLSGGGLGNQLMELAGGLAQAERLGCPLYLDASVFDSPYLAESQARNRETPRPCQLFDYELPAIDITDRSPRRGERLPHPRLGEGMPSWVAVGSQLVNVPHEPGYVSVDDAVVPGTVLMGLFHHPRYLESVLPRMLDMLDALRLTDDEQAFVDRLRADPRTTIHLRRGDYLTVSYKDWGGLTSTGYAVRAMRLLRRLDPGSRFRVYSDSPEHVRADLEDGDEVVMAPDNEALRPSALLTAMAESRDFVMSNSTLSWWAAALVGHRDPAATVVVPRPFHQHPMTGGSQLPLPHWISVGNQ